MSEDKDLTIRDLLSGLNSDPSPRDKDAKEAVERFIEGKKSRSEADTNNRRAEAIALLKLEEEARRRRDHQGFKKYYPEEGPLAYKYYRRHMRFFSAGKDYRQRIFRAGNRTGKTLAGCFEVVLHATGMYPKWWTGRVFEHATKIWVAGDTNQTTRDILQQELMGDPGKFGTGQIPKDMIVSWKSKPSVPNAIEYVEVKNIYGGTSIIGFKSYDQGRESFQGTARDFILLDEEPPADVYAECLIRTMITDEEEEGGCIAVTFTPLRGYTPFVMSFEEDADTPEYGPEAPIVISKPEASKTSKFFVQAGMKHVPHLTPEAIKEGLEGALPHEIESRMSGIPSMGAGAVYPIPAEEYVEDPQPREAYWRKAYALDVGWEKTAIVWGAYNPDDDIIHIYAEHYRGNEIPEVHAATIMHRGGKHMRGVVDPAARGRNQSDGTRLIDQYRRLGCKIIPADNAVEAGIYEVWSRLSTGRLKISSTCVNLLQEMRMYRRDEQGKIIKSKDHLCDALRYWVMSAMKVARPDKVTKQFTGKGARNYGV